MPETRIWTREEVLALPDDGNRHELVAGQLVMSPSPRPAHQLALYALSKIVHEYVERHGLGITWLSPADVDLGLGDLCQPDLFVTAPRDSPIREWSQLGVPLLVVEVVSRSTARQDRVIKRRRYQAAGVATYWIVDLDARLVEIWEPNIDQPAIADRILRWAPSLTLPSLDIALEEYFQPEWQASDS